MDFKFDLVSRSSCARSVRRETQTWDVDVRPRCRLSNYGRRALFNKKKRARERATNRFGIGIYSEDSKSSHCR